MDLTARTRIQGSSKELRSCDGGFLLLGPIIHGSQLFPTFSASLFLYTFLPAPTDILSSILYIFHCFMVCILIRVHAQSCSTLFYFVYFSLLHGVHPHMRACSVMFDSLQPCDCSPPGSSVHGNLQARILEWVAISSSRGSSWPRDQTCVSCVSCIGRQVLYHWATWGPCFFRTVGFPGPCCTSSPLSFKLYLPLPSTSFSQYFSVQSLEEFDCPDQLFVLGLVTGHWLA